MLCTIIYLTTIEVHILPASIEALMLSLSQNQIFETHVFRCLDIWSQPESALEYKM